VAKRDPVPLPQERPDLWYWDLAEGKRPTLSEAKLHELVAEVGTYSEKRFVSGYRFRLVGSFCGIPAGTGCTVVKEWPNTLIRWDKWSKEGFGSKRSEMTLSVELDMHLQHMPASNKE